LDRLNVLYFFDEGADIAVLQMRLVNVGIEIAVAAPRPAKGDVDVNAGIHKKFNMDGQDEQDFLFCISCSFM
jgi:hypothetical protein